MHTELDTELKELIWDSMVPVMRSLMFDDVDLHLGRNTVIEHRENGLLKGAVLYHDVDPDTVELEGVYVSPTAENKMAFLKMYKKATYGKNKVQTITQKKNEKLIKAMESAGFKKISEEGIHVKYLKERRV